MSTVMDTTEGSVSSSQGNSRSLDELVRWLTEQGDYSTARLVQDGDPFGVLVDLICQAGSHHDDERTLRYLEMLRRLKLDGPRAMELLELLPKDKHAGARAGWQATLPRTKRVLWEMVARHWQETPDDEAAKRAFRFLVQLPIHEDEREVFFEVLKKVAGRHFAFARLLRCITLYPAIETERSPFHHLFKVWNEFLAWAVGQNLFVRENLTGIAALLHPLLRLEPNELPGALPALGRDLYNITSLLLDIRRLKGALVGEQFGGPDTLDPQLAACGVRSLEYGYALSGEEGFRTELIVVFARSQAEEGGTDFEAFRRECMEKFAPVTDLVRAWRASQISMAPIQMRFVVEEECQRMTTNGELIDD